MRSRCPALKTISRYKPAMAYHTPKTLAAELGCSERALRSLARDIGACRIVGKRMIFLDEDVAALLDAMKPAPRRTPFTREGVELPTGGYAALVAAREAAKALRDQHKERDRKRRLDQAAEQKSLARKLDRENGR